MCENSEFTDQPQENENNIMMVEDAQESNVDSGEIEALNHRLDELHSALDSLEEKNDEIQARLLDLLASNRSVRQTLQEICHGESEQPQKN